MSSVANYDIAVLKKIKALFPNTVYQERSFVFKTLTDTTGKVKSPLISIFRPDGWSVSGDGNTDALNKQFLNGVRSLYVDLVYQFDIWANTREDLEEITAELVLYLIKNPSVRVIYESADGSQSRECTTSLVYLSGPERTSEMDDTTVGRLYRYTLTYNASSALLFVFGTSQKNPDGSIPEGYVPKITTVVVKVIAETDINSIGDTDITEYKSKEDIYE